MNNKDYEIALSAARAQLALLFLTLVQNKWVIIAEVVSVDISKRTKQAPVN